MYEYFFLWAYLHDSLCWMRKQVVIFDTSFCLYHLWWDRGLSIWYYAKDTQADRCTEGQTMALILRHPLLTLVVLCHTTLKVKWRFCKHSVSSLLFFFFIYVLLKYSFSLAKPQSVVHNKWRKMMTVRGNRLTYVLTIYMFHFLRFHSHLCWKNIHYFCRVQICI